ncbi:MAG: tRNA1(Val) (adenine(37)-N6)-methyltransferase [Bacteroidia bacterium]
MSRLFRFKQFTLDDSGAAMKLGTDAVLLGALATQQAPKQILDIGTGSGIIALQLAQRFTEAKITGVDIESGAVAQATANFKASSWAGRLTALEADICHWHSPLHYDLICCNPPFYATGFPITHDARKMARQQHGLSIGELAKACASWLTPLGSAWMIMPSDSQQNLLSSFASAQLYPIQVIHIQPKADKATNRIIAAFGREKPQTCKNIHICIRNADGHYSEAYLQIVQDFYLFA